MAIWMLLWMNSARKVWPLQLKKLDAPPMKVSSLTTFDLMANWVYWLKSIARLILWQKNESFREFCSGVAKTLVEEPEADFEVIRTSQVTKVGENIQIGRHSTLEVEGSGMVAAYIHTGAKVGVLVEVGAGKDETTSQDAFKSLVKDITLQIAAANPTCVSRESVDPELIAKEKAITAEQFKDKPAQAVEQILKGKMEKFPEYLSC